MVHESASLNKPEDQTPADLVPPRCIPILRPRRWTKWQYKSGLGILQTRRCARCNLHQTK